LKLALGGIVQADAPQLAKKICLALTSAGGASRHARRRMVADKSAAEAI
jgi:hypothetical protein